MSMTSRDAETEETFQESGKTRARGRPRRIPSWMTGSRNGFPAGPGWILSSPTDALKSPAHHRGRLAQW